MEQAGVCYENNARMCGEKGSPPGKTGVTVSTVLSQRVCVCACVRVQTS